MSTYKDKDIVSLKSPTLSVVMPCFNEEAGIELAVEKIMKVIEKMIPADSISRRSFIVLVDDGSRDLTWAKILKIKAEYASKIKALKLSRNFGHQNALLAGLTLAKESSDCIISIDADLQQDENKIPNFVKEFKAGSEIVFGIRNDRKSDSFLKKSTALFFYKLMNMFGTKVIKNHADYRLISKRVADILVSHREKSLFLRGLVANLGFKSSTVYFDVKERQTGKTSYSLKKMLVFAGNGITSFSIKPLEYITAVGFIIFIFSLIMGIYILVEKYCYKQVLPGWASIVLPIYFLGGIQILCIGILGEYIGKSYIETKDRPNFIIDQQID